MQTTFQLATLKDYTTSNMRVVYILSFLVAVLGFDYIIASYCNWIWTVFVALIIIESVAWFVYEITHPYEMFDNDFIDFEQEYRKEKSKIVQLDKHEEKLGA